MTTPCDFRGQVALVTGVGRRGQIGWALARALGEAGAALVLADRSAQEVTRRAEEIRALGCEVVIAAGDLTEPDVAQHAVSQAVGTFGRLDVVVNAAGGLTVIAPTVETEAQAFDEEYRKNVSTAFLVSRAALGPMLDAGRGAIVNFASVAAFTARPQLAAYSAAKSAVAALTRSMAAETRDRGVRVNAVAPGLVRTEQNVADLGEDGGIRWVEIDEVVAAVLFLATASGITGHVLPVLGGDI